MNDQNNNGFGMKADEHTAGVEKMHTLILQARKRLEITGVSDVLRFDELTAELSTSLGDLLVEGEGLRIEIFDTEKGIVTLCGEIRTLDYYDAKSGAEKSDKKRGFFGKR